MVPKGTDVNIFVYAVHHNPDVFPNPEQFDPERFMDGYDLRKSPYEYIPFSAGQRNCVGT
jgi:cytochrome P450 family 4